jgi:LacI family transcriptional regulator
MPVVKSMTNRSPVTLSDVARAAGVSLATASRSLNGSAKRVNDELRERVLETARQLNYTPNLSAQAVAKGASSTVALLVSDVADPYFSSIAAGVMRAAEARGLIVTMAATGRSSERELELVRILRGQRPRVIIIAGSRFSEPDSQDSLVAELRAYEETGGIVVLISQHELPFSTVLLDNRAGARDLARTLVGQGYRRFGAITGAPSLITSADRVSGFAEGLAEHGLSMDPQHIVETEFSRNGGYAGAQELLSRGLGDLQLIFAVSDIMAIGAMSALRDASVSVPETLAIAGYDDIPTARDVTPALTTMHIALDAVGEAAIDLAFSETAGAAGTAAVGAAEVDAVGAAEVGAVGPDAPQGQIVRIGADVVVRESTPKR